MTREEIQALADRYQRIADRAYQNYQDSGIGRYSTKWRDNKRLADALRIAANEAADHSKMVLCKLTLSHLASKASLAKASDPETAEKLVDEILKDLIAYGQMNGVKLYESDPEETVL